MIFFHHRGKAPLPSRFVNKFQENVSKPPGHIFTYDRDVVCLPKDFSNVINKRFHVIVSSLSEYGLTRRIRLTSDMTEDELFVQCSDGWQQYNTTLVILALFSSNK